MKIAYIAAGAAGMFCGSCLHDNTLARALLKRGERVTLVPTYTPLRTDEQDVSARRVFFGGVNVYLAQAIPGYRWVPRWLRRVLDHPTLLRMATSGGGSVDPAKLGPMTLSMLQGELGGQRAELEELVDWLLEEVQPDVVHLSNSMLLGMARRIAQRCGPPVVCALSGEDLFLSGLLPPYDAQARDLLRERAAEVDAFTTLNDYYADTMADYLAVPRERIHAMPHGLDLEGYPTAQRPASTGSKEALFRIGYLARVCHDKGLHVLVQACELLAKDRAGPKFELLAAGYLGRADRPYLRRLEKRAAAGELAGRFRYLGELTREQKIEFLSGLDVFSTPTVYREAKGLPALEALACGTPVVLPSHGSFPEIVAMTGGGVLFQPHDPIDLAAKLRGLLEGGIAGRSLGEAGRIAVRQHLTADQMAEQMLGLYQRLTAAAAE